MEIEQQRIRQEDANDHAEVFDLIKETWIEIASQLRQPSGQKGVEISDMMGETNRNMIQHAIRQIQLNEGEVVLELGHGNGAHIPGLLGQKKNVAYYGLEISTLMHEQALKLLAAEPGAKSWNVQFDLYDGLKTPYKNHFFDKIFTVNTLYFWSDPKELLSELYRILKPSGILCITYADKSFMETLPFTQFGFTIYDEEKMRNLIAETEFSIQDMEVEFEKVRSKTGELVTRKFTTVRLIKTS